MENYYCTKTGLDAAKTASKKVVYKTAEATGEFIGNKIDANSRNYSARKKEKKFKRIKKSIL